MIADCPDWSQSARYLYENGGGAAKTAASAVTAPAQSEERPPDLWLPSLSDDERLVEEHARSFDLALYVEIRTLPV